MIFDILSIFPDLLHSPLQEGIIKRARKAGHIDIRFTDIRDFAFDKHRTTDDRPYGGGEGMVLKPEPLEAALSSIRKKKGDGRVILLSPQGRQYTQQVARELSEQNHVILVCGRYEGVDERFITESVDDEISIGDYILTGGELAAMVIIDSVTRLLPGVLGCSDSAEKDTFSRQLLKHPQYTRPVSFNGSKIPEILLSGNHRKVDEYRFICSVKQTLKKRPDLLQNVTFSQDEIRLLKKNKLYNTVNDLYSGTM